jgi:hypothetical protein
MKRRKAMNKETMTKIFSTTLSLALMVTSAPMPAGAVGPVGPAGPAFLSKLTPPEQFGYVASSYAPNNETHPRLIVIADLHAHIEVQHHIKGILEHVVSQLRSTGSSMAGKTVPIFVEGGWENHLEEPLKPVQNSSVRGFLAEYLLNKAEINAAQSFSENVAGSNQVALIGAETKAEYLFNRAQFLKTYPARKALLQAIENEEVTIRDISKYLTNGTFAHLQELRDGYNAGRVRPETFARALVQLARHNGINTGHVRVLENISTASQTDLDVALSEVYRSVIKAVSSKRPLTAFLRASIDNEDSIRENLARIDASLDLLKRLVADQLTPSEVPLVVVRMSELIQTAQLLLAKSPLKDTAAQVIHDSFNFYPLAKLRDQTLSENSLKALDSFGPDATGILVAGGFHTEAIAERLREKGISYMVINPSITRDLTSEEQLNYMRRMGDEHVTVGEIERDVDSLRRQQPVHATAASGALSDIDSEKTNDPSSKPYLGGTALVKMNAIIANDAKALTTLIAEKQVAIDLTQAAKMDPSALRQAQKQVMAIAKEETLLKDKVNALGDALASPDNMFISLKNVDGQFETSVGLQDDDATALADRFNGSIKANAGGLVKAAAVSRINIIGIDNATQHLGSPARVYMDDSGVRTIVMEKERLKTWMAGRNATDPAGKAAFDRADQTITHEAEHIFGKDVNELETTLMGVAVQALREAKTVGLNNEAAVRNAIQRVIGSLFVDASAAKDGGLVAKILSADGLAAKIADVISPEALDDVNAQRIFNALKSVEPEATDAELKGAIEGNLETGYSRASNGSKDHKQTALEIIKNLGMDPKALSDADREKVVAELANQLTVELAEARAILDAA